MEHSTSETDQSTFEDDHSTSETEHSTSEHETETHMLHDVGEITSSMNRLNLQRNDTNSCKEYLFEH